MTGSVLDRHNDHVQIYAAKANGTIKLTDDGYVLADLRTSGVDLDTPKRRAVFDSVLNGFGVRESGRELFVEASPSTLGQRVHSLVQAILAINDMFVLAQPRVASFFYEDVKAFLLERDVRFSDRVKVAGRSGYDHAIDFLIPSWKDKPERFVQTISTPTKATVTSTIFAISDTREGRPTEVEAYTFLNDQVTEVGGDLTEALEAYGLRPAPWSRREDVIAALV